MTTAAMPKLQPNLIFNRELPNKKRKANEIREANDERKQDEVADSTASKAIEVSIKRDRGGALPRKNQTDAVEPKSSQNASCKSSEYLLCWPGYFDKLLEVHKALNLVFTFCCTRKHFATTFENIKSTVESHIHRELKIEDVAIVKTLLPLAVRFEYVSESALQVNLIGREQGSKYLRIGDMPPLASLEHKGNRDHEVLLFEFIDRDLKRQVTNAKTGEPMNAVRKLRQEELRMPVYSQKQMLNLIEKRNMKFRSVINSFLNQCNEDKQDPVEVIKEQAQCYIPKQSGSMLPTASRGKQAGLPLTVPAERKCISEIISDIKKLEWYKGQIVLDGHRVFDPQPAVYDELDFELSQNLINALYNARNITKLYAHQAEALNNLQRGRNVIISTSTSSGKSLIYQIPILHELEIDRNTRALYIFPTKALAQDQKRSIKNLLSYMGGLEDILVETFDGDTQSQDRDVIRRNGRIVLTNPDMLHITILPQEEAWRTFLENLKYVVVDELHVYNGLFGSHMSFIMRRLRRICAALGNKRVKFISCSATVANPEEHMRTIFGVDDVQVTDFDGSPSGRKEFICWNVPYKDPGDPSSGRVQTVTEAAKVFCQLILRGVRVIAFCKIRRQCELLLNAIKAELNTLERLETMARVMAYRGGYTPQDRRKIEREMFEGKLIGIVATSALELGIDIGSLDAVVSVGFPYTIANLRQQSGRAGRRNKDSLSVLIGDCFPTDQYFMQNPDEIFTRPNCAVQVDLQNMLALEGHVQCAAFEMPIRLLEDEKYFGHHLSQIAEERMVKDVLGYYHCADRFRPYPSKFVSIRDTEDDHFAIVNITNSQNEILEELEASRAFFTIYEGGIFLHQGNTYIVREFSQEHMLAKVERVNVDWTTQQRDFTDIDPIETEAIHLISGSQSRAFYGPIKIVQVVYGFFKVDKRGRILDAVEVDNPPITIFSKGMWLDVPRSALEILRSHRLNIAGAIHAAEHTILSLMPNYVISMPGDVRTECKIAEKELSKKETTRKRPARLTFYDSKGGASGSGISTKAFDFIDLLLRQACDRLTTCLCFEGCLECCCSETCRDANQVMSKAGAEVILKSLLNFKIDLDALPWGEEERIAAGVETVIVAEEIRPRHGQIAHFVDAKELPNSIAST